MILAAEFWNGNPGVRADHQEKGCTDQGERLLDHEGVIFQLQPKERVIS